MTTTNDAVFEAALDKLATATSMMACSSEPADHAAIAAVTLATATLAPGDFTNGDRTGGGMEVTIDPKTVAIASGGTFNYVAYTDGTTLLHTKDGTPQALVFGGDVTFPSTTIGFTDPSV